MKLGDKRKLMTNQVLVATDRAELTRAGILPFDAGANVFLSTLAGKTDRTRELYSHSLEEFFTWLQDRGIEGVNAIRPIDLVDYRNLWADREQAGEYKASTIANRLVALRRFLERMAAEGFLHPRITQDFIRTYLASPKTVSGRLPVYLERDEIQALLSVITDPRDQALFTLALGAGLRVSELVGLHLGDIRPLSDGAAILEVRRGKGGKARSFKIPHRAMRPLTDYVHHSGRTWRRQADLDTWLFPGNNGTALHRSWVNKLLGRYVRKAAIEKPVHPHTLRHTFATHYVASGGNPAALAEILGHANLQTVMVYVHLGRMLRGDTYEAEWLNGA